MKKIRNLLINKYNHEVNGFSLLEVLLGITIFMIGMLGVTALNISSLKSNTFSGNMSEAVIIAGDRLERLLALDFDDPDLQDTDGDGAAGLEETGNDDDPGTVADADHSDPAGPIDPVADPGIGRNSMYYVYWNVEDDNPVPVKTKTVNVIVEWSIKDVKRRMNMSMIIQNDD